MQNLLWVCANYCVIVQRLYENELLQLLVSNEEKISMCKLQIMQSILAYKQNNKEHDD